MRALPPQLPRDPEPDFALVLARARRLAGADNKTLSQVLAVSPSILKRIDDGSIPDYPTGNALIKLLQQLGGDLSGIMR
jgi:ribosome-binding protein aMBF1 (putative translation factor)